MRRASVAIFAFVDDLMDRSRVRAAIDEVQFVRSIDAIAGGDAEVDDPEVDDPEVEVDDAEVDHIVVIVDLVRHAQKVADLREHLPAARIVCFGPHVDESAANKAQADGADVVMPRSRFFRDPRSAIAK